MVEYRLENGLRVVLAPDKSKPTISVNVTYLVGSRMESAGETGMAHLLEHLVFKGTPSNPQIFQELTRRGMRPNGTTWYDRTNYFETFAAIPEDLEWVLSMEADRMVNSVIAKKDLDSEMTVVRNEMERGDNNVGGMLAQLMEATAFRWHAYGKPTIGARSDVENVSIENLQAFYRKYYQPDNAVLVVAGYFEPQQTLDLINRYFGAILKPTRHLRPSYTVEPPQEGPRRVELARVGENRLVSVLYHVPPAMHPDQPALEVLRQVLTSTGGRLQEALVKQRKATSVWGSISKTYDPGYAMFGAQLRRDDDPAEATRRLLQALEEITEQPITDEEIARAQQAIRSGLDRQLDDPASFGVGLSQSIAVGDWRSFFWFREQVAKVSTADVTRVAQTYFKPANRTLGEFVPMPASSPVVVPGRADLTAMLDALPTQSSVAVGEDFDSTPANIDGRTIRASLKNGLQLAMLPKKTRGERVVLEFNLRWGDSESLASKGALISLISNMMLSGTEKYGRTQLAKKFEQLDSGVAFNATGQSMTVTLNTRRRHFAEAVVLLSEILRKSTFPQDEFERIKRSRIGAVRTAALEPSTQASLALSRYLTPREAGDVRYVLDEKEFETRVNALSRTDLVEFWRSFPGADHAWASAVGDFDPDEMSRLLQDAFSGWYSAQAYRSIADPYQDVPAKTRLIEVRDKKNAQLLGGLHIPVGEKDHDYPALLVATHLFGGGFLSSRLAMRLRQKEGLSYSVSASLSSSASASKSTLNLSAIYAPQNRARVEQAVLEEMQRMFADGFSVLELENGRKALLQARRLALTEDRALGTGLVRNLRFKRDFSFAAIVDERIAGMTLDELNAVVRKYCDPGKLSLVFAGSFYDGKTPG
ncbi:M16 family metallopeptidase [Uliginosibacterium flavum]